MTEILLVLKATVLVVAALLLRRLGERRVPAALRALVLTGTFAALLILPVAALVLPPLPVPMTPQLAGLFEPIPSMAFDADALSVDVESGQTSGAGAAAESPRGDRRPAADASTPSAVAVVRLVWLAGVLIIGVRLAIGLWTLRRLRRTAVPWPEGAALARHLLGEGFAVRTEIVLQPGIGAPMTYGVMRPVVALPPDAPQWPASHLRRALIHELEHVRRADWGTQLLASVVCAIYWFHPLVWMAARRLRLAMEQACDDVVVRHEDGTAYAEQLVALARRLSAGPAIVSLGIAAGGALSQRVAAVLDPASARGAVGPAAAVPALAVVLGLAALMAPLEARARDDAANPTLREAVEVRPFGTDATRRATALALERAQAKPAFDVASIRKWTPGGGGGGAPFRHANGAFDRPRNTVASLVEFAFDVQSYQVVGGADWMRRDLFAVHARTAETASLDQMRLMVQSLLEERFGLGYRHEQRQMPIYTLTRARPDGRLGPGLQPAADPARAHRELKPAPSISGALRSTGCGSMAQLITLISPVLLGAPVVDRTGLIGAYEWSYFHSREGLGIERSVEPGVAFPPLDPNVPSLPIAFQEQLGLKLEATRGEMPVVVIEAIRQPTDN